MLNLLGIYPGAIENALKTATEAYDEICDMIHRFFPDENHNGNIYDKISEYLSENGNFNDITYSIITAAFNAVHDLVKRSSANSVLNIDVCYYVNCDDSQLSYADGSVRDDSFTIMSNSFTEIFYDTIAKRLIDIATNETNVNDIYRDLETGQFDDEDIAAYLEDGTITGTLTKLTEKQGD